jgi:hypothetical protein
MRGASLLRWLRCLLTGHRINEKPHHFDNVFRTHYTCRCGRRSMRRPAILGSRGDVVRIPAA